MDRRKFLGEGVVASLAIALTTNQSQAALAGEATNYIVNVKDFGAIGNGVANDLAACQRAVNAVCARQGAAKADGTSSNLGGVIVFPDGVYNFGGGTLYCSNVGAWAGQGIDGITIQGTANGGTQIKNGIISIGNRTVATNDQGQSTEEDAPAVKYASNSINVRDLAITGALEMFSCQRASTIQNVRIIPKNKLQGLLLKYCNAMMLIGVRVDNGGSEIDGIVVNRSPDLTFVGGGSNYCKNGIRFVTGDGPSITVRMIGVHLEGNRRVHLDLWNVKNASIQVHVVASEHYFTEGLNLPLIRVRDSENVVFQNTYVWGGFEGAQAPLGIDIKNCNLTVVEKCMFGALLTPIRAPNTVTKGHFEQHNLIK